MRYGALNQHFGFNLALLILSILVPAEGLPGRRFAHGIHIHPKGSR